MLTFFTFAWRSWTNSLRKLCRVCSSRATVSSRPWRSCRACSRRSNWAVSSVSRLDFSASSCFSRSLSFTRRSCANCSFWLALKWHQTVTHQQLTVSRYKLKQCILALYATYKNLKICILNVNNVFIIKFLTNIRFRQRSGITALITHSVVSLMAACFSVISCLNSASWRWCCSRCDSICRSSASFICCADAIWSISLSFSANWDEYSWPVWNANSRIQLDDSALFILKKSNKTQNYTKQNKSTTTRKKQTHFTACIQWRSGWSSTRFIKNHLFTVIIISQVTFSNLLHILWNTASSLLPTLQIFTNYLLLCYLWPD